jgi:uncharacterized protein
VTVALSRGEARRVALVAQGFRDPRHLRPSMRTVARTIGRTGVLQVDSVNVLQRAHYMPLFARIGPYDVELLHRAQSGRERRRLVEYWAHVQALMPVELWPLMQHRMADYRERRGKWWRDVPTDLTRRLLAEITDRGALTARDLDDGRQRSREHWGWNWSAARQGLDLLYMVGDLAVAGRNSQFEVVYDLPERVLPGRVLALPTPPREDVVRELVRRAAISHGIATENCLRDYYRLGALAQVRPAIADLVEAGELVPARVEGWRRPAYLHAGTKVPRRVSARALLSPFDPLVWERERTERLFDFHYRIEIYVPAHLRRHGYYVLPFLLGDRIVGRVDLKADRRAGVLRVPAAYAEQEAPDTTAGELAAELWTLAGWLGLAEVAVDTRGDLSGALAAEVSAGPCTAGLG